MFVSLVGFVVFKYGRKQQRLPHTVIGLLVMLYPYATDSTAWMLGLLPVFLGLLWLAVRFGL
jgi:hypothetical protein